MRRRAISRDVETEIAAILAIAAATLAARQITTQATVHGVKAAASVGAKALTIVPLAMMRKAGPLPQTEVASYY